MSCKLHLKPIPANILSVLTENNCVSENILPAAVALPDFASFYKASRMLDYSRLWEFFAQNANANLHALVPWFLDGVSQEERTKITSPATLADLLTIYLPPTREWFEFLKQRFKLSTSLSETEIIFRTLSSIASPEECKVWVEELLDSDLIETSKKDLYVSWALQNFYSELGHQEQLNFAEHVFLQIPQAFFAKNLMDYIMRFEDYPLKEEMPANLQKKFSAEEEKKDAKYFWKILAGKPAEFCYDFEKSSVDIDYLARAFLAYQRAGGDFSKFNIASCSAASFLLAIANCSQISREQKDLVLTEFQKNFFVKFSPEELLTLQQDLILAMDTESAQVIKKIVLEAPNQKELLSNMPRLLAECGFNTSKRLLALKKIKLACIQALLLEKNELSQMAVQKAKEAAILCSEIVLKNDADKADYDCFYQDFLPEFPLLKQTFLETWDSGEAKSLPDQVSLLGIGGRLPPEDSHQFWQLNQKHNRDFQLDFDTNIFQMIYQSKTATEYYLEQLEQNKQLQKDLFQYVYNLPALLPRGRSGLLPTPESNQRLGEVFLERSFSSSDDIDNWSCNFLALSIQPVQYQKLLKKCSDEWFYSRDLIRVVATIKKRIIHNKSFPKGRKVADLTF